MRRKDITFEPLYQHPFPARPSAEWNHDDVVQVLLVMLWKDYADGFISLKKLQHLAVGTTTTLADGRRRDQLLGKLMRCAVAVEPKRRGRLLVSAVHLLDPLGVNPQRVKAPWHKCL